MKKKFAHSHMYTIILDAYDRLQEKLKPIFAEGEKYHMSGCGYDAWKAYINKRFPELKAVAQNEQKVDELIKDIHTEVIKFAAAAEQHCIEKRKTSALIEISAEGQGESGNIMNSIGQLERTDKRVESVGRIFHFFENGKDYRK